MPEDTIQVVENATQGEPAETERTFTQDQVNKIMGELRSKERAKYADYDELKAKANKFDELEEASKSELQKAVEERDRYKAEIEAMKAEKEHADLVAKVAAEQGVDASLLARMSGDVEDNAAFIKAQMENTPKYEAVHDGGEVKIPQVKTDIPIIF